MKWCKLLFTGMLVSCLSTSEAQKPSIHLSTGVIKPASYYSPYQFSDGNLFEQQKQGNYYYTLVHFTVLPTDKQRKELEEHGIILGGYYPYNTYACAIPVEAQKLNWDMYNVSHFIQFEPTLKVANKLQYALYLSDSVALQTPFMYSVNCFSGISKSELQTILTQHQINISSDIEQLEHRYTFTSTLANLQKIASLPFVVYVDKFDTTVLYEDFNSLTNHRINAVQTNDNYVTGKKYTGDSVIIALGDDGDVGPHIDFTGRIISNATSTGSTNTHGDHTAGIIIGAGNYDPTVQGQAPGALMRVYNNYATFNAFPNLYRTQRARITSHSLGQVCNTGYDNDAQTSDLQLNTYPELLHVHSAGNSGTTTCGGINGGWSTITGGYKAGKNTVTVANVSVTDQINSSSSKGPLPDGRLKPDIAADGTNINSTQPNNTFAVFSGTSMSCPGIAGVLAVMLQAYKANNGNQNPVSAVLKSILLNTADDIGNRGPDFTNGWGRVNARRAINCIENNRFFRDSISNGATKQHSITIPANVTTAKIMVYWNDKDGTPGAALSLVNDIDSKIISPTNTTTLPWRLFAGATPTATSCAAAATRGRDSLNNVEQIQLDNPAAGTYTLEVSGQSIPFGPQQYVVVTEFLYTNEIVVTHPAGGETLIPGETTTVRWDATGTSGPFTVAYSSDEGATWTNLTNNVSGSLRYYSWKVPATLTTAKGLIKVSRGTASDVSDTNFIVLGQPSITTFTNVCKGTSTINWTPVTGATGYDVFKLGKKYMELAATTTGNGSTSATVSNLGNSLNWFAVRAKLGNNQQNGRRSIATSWTNSTTTTCVNPVSLIDFTTSLKTNNQLLVQWKVANEVGIMAYVVEKSFNADFKDLIVVGSIKANNAASTGNKQYELTDNQPALNGAITYYRIRIVEPNQLSYSWIISYQSNEIKTAIQIYPNPARSFVQLLSNETINDATIQIIQTQGQIVLTQKVQRIPAKQPFTLALPSLLSGTYIVAISTKTGTKPVEYIPLTIIK